LNSLEVGLYGTKVPVDRLARDFRLGNRC
jgi:hypothetical protein